MQLARPIGVRLHNGGAQEGTERIRPDGQHVIDSCKATGKVIMVVPQKSMYGHNTNDHEL